jgi:hypothetical protein
MNDDRIVDLGSRRRVDHHDRLCHGSVVTASPRDRDGDDIGPGSLGIQLDEEPSGDSPSGT